MQELNTVSSILCILGMTFRNRQNKSKYWVCWFKVWRSPCL